MVLPHPVSTLSVMVHPLPYKEVPKVSQRHGTFLALDLYFFFNVGNPNPKFIMSSAVNIHIYTTTKSHAFKLTRHKSFKCILNRLLELSNYLGIILYIFL